MSATDGKSSAKQGAEKSYVFPVGAAGKRELRRELKRAKDPEKTIESFQQSHSLHFMVSKAFGTMSIPESQQSQNESTTRSKSASNGQGSKSTPVESLDSDSVMTFLSHLGVSQFEVHKRISDSLLKQLEDEVRKTKSEEPLLGLLRESWSYAVTLPELRPIIWAVLKQLGEKTPPAVLHALAEREADGTLKHAEIFRPLPALLKKLVWEGDWVDRFPNEPDLEPEAFLNECQKTLLYETMHPLIEQYCTNKGLSESADLPFVASIRERRMLTTQRRALTASSSSAAATDRTPTKASGILAGGTAGAESNATNSSPERSPSKAISQLRVYLSDSGGSTSSSYRPKLLYALMSMLVARHGGQKTAFLAGAEHLHCTLVSDILLSAGGPLPKAYHHVHILARLVDECVQEGSITNEAIKNIQNTLQAIFEPDRDGVTDASEEKGKANSTEKEGGANSSSKKKEDRTMTNALQRQLNNVITTGIAALKEIDLQNLFLVRVTDKIAQGYSKIIKRPMCILDMEHKIDTNDYKSTEEWKRDVELMYKNCLDYNKGKAGQWFRGEAMRQKKVFEEEIFPQARKYQKEIDKRKAEEEDRKRKAQFDEPAIKPLEKSNKKRRKEKEEFQPSMTALTFMILSDPFFIRIVLGRVLREARVGVVGGVTLPAASFVIPSLLQFLHMARWSTKICKIRAKRYFVPSGGMQSDDTESEDPGAFVPYSSLRKVFPLVLRLLLEAELDKRVITGGDLHEAAISDPSLAPQTLLPDDWVRGEYLEVPVTILQSAIVYITQPGSTTDLSLAITFPKFATALGSVSDMKGHRLFFKCLVRSIMRHKTKLSQDARDAIVTSWLAWLSQAKTKSEGSMTSEAHEYFVTLLNEWSSIGNQILPRDAMLRFVSDAVKAAESSETKREERSFAALWAAEEPNPFTLIKKQYLRMLNHLPSASAESWTKEMGITI